MNVTPKIVETDVLVIGGGFSGCWAAYRASELGAKTILVEKGFVSTSGCSAVSGGVTTAPLKEDNFNVWEEEFREKGHYMSNPEWIKIILKEQQKRIKDYESWGVPFVRDEHGEFMRLKTRGMNYVRAAQFNPREAMKILRKKLELSCQIYDRMIITDLITGDGEYPTNTKVIGAVGFQTRTGEPHIFFAKSTILATGPLNVKGFRTIDNVLGEGISMAFRAGATLVDMEFSFGGTFTLLNKEFHLHGFNIAVGHGAKLINRHGQRFMEKYDPERMERSELPRVVAAFMRELEDGNGPVFIDFRDSDPNYFKNLETAVGKRSAGILTSGKLPDLRTTPIPIEPDWSVWSHQSGVRIMDMSCRTSVAGLYAVGSMVRNEAVGTHSSAGIPTAFCNVSGYLAGEEAAKNIKNYPLQKNEEAAKYLIEEALRPLHQKNGEDPHILFEKLSSLIGNPYQTMFLNDALIKDTIREIEIMKMTKLKANDIHSLVKVHEFRNNIECIWMVYKSCEVRKESREPFFRTDFPETDDYEWFCWLDVNLTNEGIQFSKREIPAQWNKSTPKKELSAIGKILMSRSAT